MTAAPQWAPQEALDPGDGLPDLLHKPITIRYQDTVRPPAAEAKMHRAGTTSFLPRSRPFVPRFGAASADTGVAPDHPQQEREPAVLQHLASHPQPNAARSSGRERHSAISSMILPVILEIVSPETAGLYRPGRAGRRCPVRGGRRAAGQPVPAIVKPWRGSWTEFIPFLDYDAEIRRVTCSTNAIKSLNARYRRAIRARGHFPAEQAAITPHTWLACSRSGPSCAL